MANELKWTNEHGEGGLLQKRTMKPNLYRVAVELSKSDNPYRLANQLLCFIKDSSNYLTDTDKDIGLLGS